MLPEEVLGQALLYLVAAVGRRVVFEDPRRFGAALYDEAWALLASPFGRKLLVEGVRDGRKHNGAIWLASQLATDFEISDLLDLLGARFVFDQSPRRHPLRAAVPRRARQRRRRGAPRSEGCGKASASTATSGTGSACSRSCRPRSPSCTTAFNTTPGTRPASPRPAATRRRRPQLVPAAASFPRRAARHQRPADHRSWLARRPTPRPPRRSACGTDPAVPSARLGPAGVRRPRLAPAPAAAVGARSPRRSPEEHRPMTRHLARVGGGARVGAVALTTVA